jgi:hypothetical protein
VEDNINFFVYILILAAIAVITFIKKLIERASSSGPQGKKIDIGEAVQRELDRYMGKSERTPPPPPAQPAPKPTPPRPKAPPMRPPVVRRAAPKEPTAPARPARKKLIAGKAVMGRAARRSRFNRATMRRAVVMAELLGRPMAERDDYRLF